MTPNVPDIVDMLIEGRCNRQQAIDWLKEHHGTIDLRSYCANSASQTMLSVSESHKIADAAFECADVMLKAIAACVNQ